MGKAIATFEDLLVWQRGMELVRQVYLATQHERFRKDFALRDQMRRAALSIPSNIAEGFERASQKEYVHFLHIAKGSAGELRSLVRVACDVGYLETVLFDQLNPLVLEVSRYLANQIKSLKAARCSE